MSAGEILLIYGLSSLFLIYGYLKHESQIINILLSMTVLLESAFLTTSYMVVKRYYIDKSIKSILLFNIFATLCSPILLLLIRSPFTNKFVDKDAVLNKISDVGVFSLLCNVNSYGFLLYQAIGVIFLFGFMIFTLIGTMHILSMVNLALENRLTKIWRWLCKSTYIFCNSAGFYIAFGVLLLIISFLLVSGILATAINFI